ncbi:MAG: substrate-binding domain-containing protein [Verrucomicrobia bacterium]|nr:substrate-binding domain-containing protein [Verrucomicrobiota bacterium]
MRRIPKRVSLAAQALDILRDDLRMGRWKDCLPCEPLLAEELRVSRWTIRAALAVLQREGTISGSQGRRRRILTPTGHAVRSESTVVGYLSLHPRHAISPFQFFCFNEVYRRLQDVGRELVFKVTPTAHSHEWPAMKDLERLVRETRASCWVLGSAQEKVQSWFSRAKIPTLVLGSTYEGAPLASVDLDLRAVCRHAVGVCLHNGHRRIALVRPRMQMAGHLAMDRGFREGVEAAPHSDAAPVVVLHDGSIKGIRSVVDALFRSAQAPTAILAAIPRHVLTIVCHLLRRGFRVPDDVSLISIEFDWYLRDLPLSLAHYEIGLERFAGRLAREVVAMATTGAIAPKRIALMPRFEPGETLGRAPK